MDIPEMNFPLMEFNTMEIEDSANDKLGELNKGIETY